MPGQDGRQRRKPAMMAMLTIATATARRIDGVQAPGERDEFRDEFAGLLPASVIPPRSRSWLAKMITAMPAVKPTVTG